MKQPEVAKHHKRSPLCAISNKKKKVKFWDSVNTKSCAIPQNLHQNSVKNLNVEVLLTRSAPEGGGGGGFSVYSSQCHRIALKGLRRLKFWNIETQ